MKASYRKTSKVTVTVSMEQLLQLLSKEDSAIPKGLPDLARTTLKDELELTWNTAERPEPF